MAASKGEKTLIELAQYFDVHPNLIKQWLDQLVGGATGVFGEAAKAAPEPVNDRQVLPTFPARRSRQFGRGRRTLCPKVAPPCYSGDDPS